MLWLGTAAWETAKPLPEGVRAESAWFRLPAAHVRFIADITAADAYGRPVASQGIFDEVLAVVRSARSFVVLDYFLFNAGSGNLAADAEAPMRPLSGELRDALLEQRRVHPGLKVLFITDPINQAYGSDPSRDLVLLRAAGVDVTVVDLDRLRDPNAAYSAFWRVGISWWSGGGNGPRWLPNPLGERAAPITFGAWARLLNFKADHRKVVIADDGHGGLVGVIGSANPHDASSAHSNVALRISGPVLAPLLQSELAIARFSGWRGEISAPDAPAQAQVAGAARGSPAAPHGAPATSDGPASRRHGARAAHPVAAAALPTVEVKVATEGAILAGLLERVRAAGATDNIDIAMFYLSDRDIIESLLAASARGAAVRLILDPNKDAFGHEKSGIPNRPVASELVSASDGRIRVRWYRTHGEQFHTKLVMIYDPEHFWFTLGSANLTRRNLADYNLEANTAVQAARSAPIAGQMIEYFETLWSNRAALGIEYTADFAVYADPAQSSYWLYRFMEGTGLSTF